MSKDTLTDAQSRLADIKAALEELHDEKQEAFDDASDAWKESEKGQKAEEILAGLQAAIEAVEQADTEIEAILLSNI